jgi:type III secretion system (T3SS) SseB-like protein
VNISESHEPFHAVNELERVLEAFVAGRTPFEPVLQSLISSQVFVLLKGEAQSEPPKQFAPLILLSSTGAPSVCLFTSSDRSLAIQRQHPEYAMGLQVAFTWIVQATPPGLGLVLNPGWSVSIEQPPEGLALFKRDLESQA